MIPKRASDLEALRAEADRQSRELTNLVATIEPSALRWRPDPTRWSVVGHVAHLGLTNAAYDRVLGGAIADASGRGGPRGDGPYRHPRVATWFVGQLEPPPKRRVRTFRSMVPDPAAELDDALARFAELQTRLGEHMGSARGLDLGRVRFGSPFLALLRLSLGTAFEAVLAHNRRHLWLIREIKARDDFPG